MNWIKKNWYFFVIALLVVFLLKGSLLNLSPLNTMGSTMPQSGGGVMMDSYSLSSVPSTSLGVRSKSISTEYAPTDSVTRLVSTNSSLTLLVKDVPSTISDIRSQAEAMGGYLVNSSLSKPDTDADGYISLRLPSDKLEEAMKQFKTLAIKTVYESAIGTDLTDQYEDLDTRLALLEEVKNKYQSILSSATLVKDILEVQRELINVQSQIDSIKGQQLYLEKSASYSLLSVNLSTDELSLPYAPEQSWRPQLVFKNSIRSLLTTFRSLGNFAIKAFVFTPVWLPILLLVIYLRRKKKTTNF